MKLYLAARYSRIEELNRYKSALESVGFEITSRWLLGDHQIDDDGLSVEAEHGLRVKFAEEDFNDVIRSEAMIAFTETPRATNSRGGRHVELGMALLRSYIGESGIMRKYPVVVVGPRENVFCCLPSVTWYPSWPDFITSGRGNPILTSFEIQRRLQG